MDHNAYEQRMIDAVNQNSAKMSKQLKRDTPDAVVTKEDKTTLKRGIIRAVIALMAAAMFTIAVIGFIAVATTPGYLAVALFITSIVMTGCGFVFLYALGISDEESGDYK